MNSTQLSDFQNYDTDNLLFSKPEVGNIPNQKITFKRIRIATRNEDGSVGDLVFSTPSDLLSFGLQESRDLNTNQINGYVFPICLWSQHGCTPEEKKFTDTFNQVVEVCKKYLLDHRDEIERYDLDASDLKKFNPLFWKMEKGKIVEGRGPMLYVKVIYNKKNEKINTIFIDESINQEIDPFKLLNKRNNCTVAIKFESIFIGNKISLQVKLYEAVVKVIDNSIRGLLRPNAIKRAEPVAGEPVEATLLDEEVEEEEEEEVVEEEVEVGSLDGDKEDEIVHPPVVLDEPEKKKGRAGRKKVT